MRKLENFQRIEPAILHQFFGLDTCAMPWYVRPIYVIA